MKTIKMLHWFFIATAIFLAVFAYILYLYHEQKNSYKDIYVEFCDEGCAYLIPKEFSPEVYKNGRNNKPLIRLALFIRNKRIEAWINLPEHKTKHLAKIENQKKCRKIQKNISITA